MVYCMILSTQVLVTKAEGKVRVRMGTDFKGPLVMRWAVSKDHAREWAVRSCYMSTANHVNFATKNV
jgi:hypothetical protein